MKRLAAIALFAGLAACQQQTTEPTTAPDNGAANMAEAGTGNDVAAQMEKLPKAALNATLIRAILDAGMKCEGVTKSERLPNQDIPTWRATCQSGEAHLIQVSPDGTAHVISRTN
ncbi:hypothetical protein [Stakelama marina]|nr:hypothetical protein [Stakelama marina]